MKAQCVVTFEFEIRPPQSWRGPVEGGAAHTILHRAVHQAATLLKPRNWSSVCAVILERDDVVKEEEDGSA